MVVDLLHVITPVLGLLVNMTFQIMGVRCVASIDYYKSIAYGFRLGLFVVLVSESVFLLLGVKSLSDSIALSTANLTVYLLIAFSYFAFINLGVSSLRVRLLDELDRSIDGLTMNEILERYNSREIIKNRVEKLGKTGQLIRKDDRYFVGRSTALLMVKILELLKFIVLGRKPRITLFKGL